MVRPPKKRVYHNFQKQNSEPERQVEPSQDAPDQEALQQADSNVDEDVTIQTPRKEDTSSPEELDGEMKDPKMSLEANESNMADSSLQEAGESQSVTPTKSRFGRSHKPKMLGDFVSTDKKVSIVLKVSPVNQFKYYKDNRNNFSPRVKHERRGRPRKSLLRDSFGSQKKESGSPRLSQTDSPSSQKISTQISPPSPEKTIAQTECSPSSQKPSQVEVAVVTKSLSVVDEMDVKVDPEEMEPDPGCEWMVGDLAWARIGNHPFWPCIIARDPELGIFTRIRMFTKSLVPHRRLHVQFFGDNGRRSWLSSTSVMNYKGRAAFEELSQSILSAMKRKDPRQVSALVVKPNLKSVWESAVNEAESLLLSSREERVLHFKRLVRKIAISQKLAVVDGDESQPPQRIKRQYRKRKAENSQADPDYVVANKQIKLDPDAVAGQSSTPPELSPRKRGRPRKTLTPIKDPLIKQEPSSSPSSSRPVRLSRTVIKMEVDDSQSSDQPNSESSSIDKVIDEVILQSEEPKKKFRSPPARSSEQMGKVRNKKAKLGAEFNKFSSKQFNKISSKNPEMGVREVEVRVEKMWKDLDDAQKSKYRSKLNCKDGGKQQEEEEEEEMPATPWDAEDTDEKTSTSEISESPLTLPLAPAKSRNKVSIFNGAFQGKVCQVCEKPGNTLRCKGPCCGTYHLECAANPRDFSARINEIFQAVNAASPSASSSPGGLVRRKKKEGARGRRKSSLVVQEEAEEAAIKKEGEEDKEKVDGKEEGEKVDGTRKSEGVEEPSSASEEKTEKVDGRRRKSLVKVEGEEEGVTNEEKKEKVDGRRRKSLVKVEGEEETVTSEEKREKVDGGRKKSVENEGLEEAVTNEEKREKVDGRRRKSLATTEGGDVEETVTNEEKKETVDGRRRRSLATTEGGDVEETVMNEEKKEKVDGRRRKSLVTTENMEEPSASEDKTEEIDEKRKKSSEGEDLEEEKVDGRTEGEGDTKSRKIDLRRKSKTESEDAEVKEKVDGRRRKSLVKTESENVGETEEKVDRRRTRLADKEAEGENEGKKEKVDGRRKKSALVKAESEESEEAKDESPTDSDVKGDKKKGAGRKGGSKESCDSSEEADSQSADFRCAACSEARLQACFVCGRDEFNGESSRQRCHVAHCGRVYHLECLKAWPQVNWIRSAGSVRGGGGGGGNGETRPAAFACPQHACHTCISDNPSVMKERFANDRLVKCLRCPASYHYGNHCLPAGTEIIAARQIICPQHSKKHKKGLHHVNASWCFICASGGSLICCDMCPTAFHADCLKISPPEGGYICEDCETGRFPLYGEIVWVKLGVYRWWPAQIMFPHHIPPNIRNLVHARGEFAVKFFGSHDFYWVNRGRVFLYQEGDSGGRCTSKRKATDQMFLRAVEEASEACMRLKNEKASREATHRSGMKPPSYIRIKTNKPVGQVRAMEANISSLTPCECDPNSANPCALDTDCLNRILMIECNPLICPAGVRCKNQQFEKREYPPLMPYRTDGRGWGLKTLVDLKKGEFVIEYVGEMINEVEYQRRLQKMHEANENNYYFLTIDKDRMLDAGPKGNVARFMNHSCQPNCETQKWTVNGDTRVGLFALHDIPAETELVFNYNLESIGTEKKPCMCGAPNCSGFIGVKASKNGNGIHTDDSVLEKQKKPRRRSRSSKQPAKLSDDVCFICQQGGELLLCDGKHCTKAYHLNCLSRNKKHPVGYWLCPWHQCNVCCRGKVYRCNFCINSYCPTHAEGNIRLEESIGYVCTKHGCTKGDKIKTDDKSKPAISESKPVESGAAATGDVTAVESGATSSNDVTTAPIHEQPPPSESASSSGVTSSSEKQNNNVVQSAELKALPRTRRARSNSDVNQTALSAKMAENGVKLLRRIRRPASVDSLTIIKESEVPLKENLLRNAVLKRRRSLKAQEERGDAPSVTSLENGESKGVVELDAVGAISENCKGGESNGIESVQMNGHIENDSLENEEDSSKMCDSTSGDEKVVENSTCQLDEKGTSEEAPNEDGKGVVNGENPEEKNEQDVSESSSQEEKIEVEENGASRVNEDVEMECESAEEKVDADKTETVEKSEDCDLDMEVTEETPKDSHNEEVPSFNEKSTKDESSSEKVTEDRGSDELRPDEKVTAKVNGILDEWSDEVSEVGETIKKNSSDSVADKETSEPLVDNCKTTLDTVAGCNSEANADANISDECVLKKSADSKKLVLPEDQDSLVT